MTRAENFLALTASRRSRFIEEIEDCPAVKVVRAQAVGSGQGGVAAGERRVG